MVRVVHMKHEVVRMMFVMSSGGDMFQFSGQSESSVSFIRVHSAPVVSSK